MAFRTATTSKPLKNVDDLYPHPPLPKTAKTPPVLAAAAAKDPFILQLLSNYCIFILFPATALC